MKDTSGGSPRIVIVGAGVGGLTTAAVLAGAGLDVTVLEAHVYSGGCAGTFYHQGYRFDAGATLAGGYYPGGPMDVIAKASGIERWPVHYDNPAMTVHLPDGTTVHRYTDERRWAENLDKLGAHTRRFWQWQEDTADALWDFALRNPPWPPQTLPDAGSLTGAAIGWLLNRFPRHLKPGLALDALRPVAAHLHGLGERMRLFVDAQLLIASQATSKNTFALYGAAALDLPRRGVVHLEGGIGAAAHTLAEAVRRRGGRVLYRQEVTRLVMEAGHPKAVETKRGESFPADIVLFNLPPWNIAPLMGEHAPARLRGLPAMPQAGGGAFMIYLGVEENILPADFPLHHQLILREPMGEGNTLFFSLSPGWDAKRAPAGRRALTISTHTRLAPWWQAFEQDRPAYERLKEAYTARILAEAEKVIPGLRDSAEQVMPGTPVTFSRFTRRAWGWVGGFPQGSLFTAWGPRLAPAVWMVGDTIFPGQSVPAVALGGLRVAATLLSELGVSSPVERPAEGPSPALN